jgi:Tfp pilus assembly protein PilF
MGSMSDQANRARSLWEKGAQTLLAGDLTGAVRLLTESLEACPTAEAYTFRGWAYSFEGRLDEAIEECLKAIATDPDFGNPYNDIGSYRMMQGRLDEAVPWLEKAKTAPRYEPRHFPHLNLGRLHALRGHNDLAAEEFLQALAHNPGDPLATAFLAEHPRVLN